MTKKQRLNICWQMWVIAEGLAILEPNPLNIERYNVSDYHDVLTYLPEGYCDMFHILTGNLWLEDLKELYERRPDRFYIKNVFWFERGNWRVRADLLLEVINSMI